MDRNRDIRVMAIINLTDDSFYSGSRLLGKDVAGAVERALKDGAQIIDLGACSTRPGSAPVSEQEEWQRLEKPLASLSLEFPGVRFSVDTFRSGIVRRCYDTIGDFLVNDVYGCDPKMLSTSAELDLEYVATSGVPCSEVDGFFRDFDKKADSTGLRRWMIDPGFGFGKVLQDNIDLLNDENILPGLRNLGRPLLIGISRKSFLYKPAGLTPETCLEQTCRAHMTALERGADILRVHDVAAAAEIIRRYKEQ